MFDPYGPATLVAWSNRIFPTGQMWLLRTRLARRVPTFCGVTGPAYVPTACLIALGGIGGLALFELAQSSGGPEPEPLAEMRAFPRAASAVEASSESKRASAEAPNVTVTVRGTLVSLTANKASLRDVLAHIAQVTGTTFSGGDTDDPVTLKAGPLPVRELIEEVLARTSYGYAYLDGVGANSGTVHARVILIAKGADGGVRPPMPQFGAAARPTPAEVAPDPEALRQQRTAESLLEACKSQACDSS